MESLKIHMVAVCLGALLTGYLLGNKGQISVLFSAKPGSTDQQRPLMVSPLLKELNCGWGNMEIPNLIKKNASFTRSLVVDIGLDAGEEFFHAVDAGFEVIGFEANPESFQNLATKCGETATCKVVENIDQISLPLEREPGMSYLIQSAVGKERGTVDFFPDGPTSTSFDMPVDVMNTSRVIQVSVISLDEVIQEDVYLLKIDTEGFDYFVLQGAKNLFESFTVRQVITKVDALLLGRNKVGPLDHMSLLYRYGMQCFTARNDQGPECNYQGDSVSELEKMFLQGISEATDTNIAAPCWDDLVCINIAKTYAGDVVNYKADDVADDVADVPEFPREWMTEALKTFEYIDKNMQDIAVPQALDMAYDRLPHGFFMRIEDGKLFINADKQMGSTEWRDQLESSKSPPAQLLCPILEMLCNKKFDKDIDFIYNVGDGPVGSYNDAPFPAFSWVKSNVNTDLLVPYLYTYGSVPRGKPQNCDFKDYIEAAWSGKQNLGIWRGTTTGAVFTVDNWRDQWRPKLVSYCNANPDICDAKISGYVQAEPDAIEQMKQELGEENQMDMGSQFQYKYSILLDGNSAPSSRMLANLESSSLIIKQDSPWIEFYYPSLRAYYHYVPLSRSIEDVKYAVEWARQHDEEVKDMIASAKSFACTHINKDTIENYVEYLFKEYAARFEGIRSAIPTEKLTLISLEEGRHRICPGILRDSCPLLLGKNSSR